MASADAAEGGDGAEVAVAAPLPVGHSSPQVRPQLAGRQVVAAAAEAEARSHQLPAGGGGGGVVFGDMLEVVVVAVDLNVALLVPHLGAEELVAHGLVDDYVDIAGVVIANCGVGRCYSC